MRDRCQRGHFFTADNTAIDKNGYRRCRECRRLREVGRVKPRAQRTHCPAGHPYSGANLYVNPITGQRRCKACKRVDYNPDATKWLDMERFLAADPWEDETWRNQAACASHPKDVFFASRGESQRMEQAKDVCRQCDVRHECLKFGLYEDFGVWGGLSDRQRRKFRSQLGVPR